MSNWLWRSLAIFHVTLITSFISNDFMSLNNGSFNMIAANALHHVIWKQSIKTSMLLYPSIVHYTQFWGSEGRLWNTPLLLRPSFRSNCCVDQYRLLTRQGTGYLAIYGWSVFPYFREVRGSFHLQIVFWTYPIAILFVKAKFGREIRITYHVTKMAFFFNFELWKCFFCISATNPISMKFYTSYTSFDFDIGQA